MRSLTISGIQMCEMALCGCADELGDTACLIPVGDVDVEVLVNVASMGGAEEDWGDFAGLELVVGPLCALRIVAEESDRGIVLVENGDAAFQLGDDSVVTVKANLARPAKMLSYGAHELSIEVEMTEAAILAIAYQQQRLVVAHIDSKSVVAVEEAFCVALARIAGFVVAVLVEP